LPFGLSTPLAAAERIKVLHGCALASTITTDDAIEIPTVGEENGKDPVHITKSALAGIIQPRCEQMLEFVRDKIEQSGFENAIGRRVVLTGGGSQLQGMRGLAEVVLDKSVRISRPTGVQGLTDLSGAPQFASGVGLLLYGARQAAQASRVRGSSGKFSQLVGGFSKLLKFS
jgi:cell division protein FtsA